MKQLMKGIAQILLLTIVLVSLLYSGITGKIAGTITDKATGEPLPGTNIVVVGTSLGAAADFEGQYSILFVPPGTYNVQISYIGYGTITVKSVRVYIDETARVDVTLQPQEIQIGESIILAERKLIKPDVATSITSISSEEITAIPTTSVMSVLGLQAGVRGGWGSGIGNGDHKPDNLKANGGGKASVQDGINIRGGSGDNMLFLMDGVTIRDPRNNEPSTKIPMSSVEEITVERGGFNAEYGQVQSGIVNVITKEGKKNSYSGGIQVRYCPPGPKYSRVAGTLDVNDPYSFALRPFFDPVVSWTGTDNGAWDQYTKSKYPSFAGWNAISKALCSDNDPTNDLTPLGAQRVFEYEIRKKQPNNKPDYDIDAGFGGPVPFIGPVLGDLRFFTSYRSTHEMLLFPLSRPDYNDYDWNFQINSDITSTMKLRFSGLIGKRFTMRANYDAGTGSYYYPHTPSEIADVSSTISSATSLFGLFSDFNFCLADVGHRSLAAKLTHSINSKTFYEVSVEHFSTDYFVRPQALRDTSQKVEVIPGFYEDSNPFGYWPYSDNGIMIKHEANYAFYRDNSVFNSTTLKADFTSQVDFQNLLKAGVEFVYNDLNFDYGKISMGGQTTEKYDNLVKMHLYPIRGGVYIQDKLEFKEFTANLGLRVDYSNSNVDWWNVSPFNDPFFLLNDTVMVFLKERSKPQWQVSPRLGIAHPISENAKLFFNYGHFKQIPQYESMFRLQRNASGAISSYGNPNIILAKTISYELGVDYSISESFLIQVAGFYHDITDQQDFTTYRSASGINYTLSTSNNYQDTRGFELTLRKSGGGWWYGFANYTYQVSTTGHFGSAQKFDTKLDQKSYDDETKNLYQDRPIAQPFARVNLGLNSPMDFGPTIFSYPILGGFGLNVVMDWQAGSWTTWTESSNSVTAYNVQTVDYFNTYLRLDKAIDIGKFKIQLFVDINNVFNTLRLWNTGDQNYLRSLHLPKSKEYNNIVGDDKVGEYRTPGVDWQPMKKGVDFNTLPSSTDRAWYFDDGSGKYFEGVRDAIGTVTWIQVEQGKVDKALNDKAYINMPNASTFWFLDPRRIFFGLKVSVNFGD
jgi:outer membrane receptor protein involved in Fe transport